MSFNSVFQGPPAGANAPGTHQSPTLGVDVINRTLYVSLGSGWQLLGVGSNGFTTAPLTIASPTGVTTYTLPVTPVNPTASFYFVNGLKRIYGTFYTISGNILTILGTPPTNGDTHEIYAS